MQTPSRRNMPAQTSFVPGQTLTAAELNNFETQSIVVGTPTAGGAIAGAVNAQALYVNGTAVNPGGTSGTPGGAAGNVQYNSAGTSFGGSTGLMLNATSVTGMTMALGTDAPGDLYFRNAAGAMARLGIGTAGQVLEVTSGLPQWATVATGGGTVSGGGASPQIAQYTAGNVVSPATISGDAAIAAGGALTLKNTGPGGTFAYPTSLTFDLQGRLTAATAGSAPTGGADTVTRNIPAAATAPWTALQSVFNEVTTVAAAGAGCALPVATQGLVCKVRNSGANPLTVYPAAGSNAVINALAAMAPITVPVDTTAYFEAVAATQWYTVP
jgi:hypothetical protein